MGLEGEQFLTNTRSRRLPAIVGWGRGLQGEVEGVD